MKSLLALGFAAGLMFAAAPAASAAVPLPVAPALAAAPAPDIVQTADDCGAGWYRGPYGACHPFGTGPYPAGYWGGAPHVVYSGAGWNGCPVGFWRGPWGNCRDTPYHGPLPGGGWQ